MVIERRGTLKVSEKGMRLTIIVLINIRSKVIFRTYWITLVESVNAGEDAIAKLVKRQQKTSK